MAIAIGIWSLKLIPGKVETIEPQADLRITNVTFGDVLQDASGRATVKFTYQAPGRIESDDEDEEEDNDVPQSPQTAVLCSLRPDTFEQASTDIVLQEHEEYTFEVVGKNTVYLTGNYIDQPLNNPPYMGSDDEMDSDDEDAYDLRDVSSDVEIAPEDLSDASRFEEVEEAPKTLKRAREADAGETVTPSKAGKKKKQKTENGKSVEASPVAKKSEVKKDKPDQKKEKSDQKKEKPDHKKDTQETEPTEVKKEKAAEREISGGVKITDAKTGTGPMAKKGNTVSMRYIGKLQNGKVFDKNTSGKPFTFHLGKGEVIKGWDEGILGMQVGGERRIRIPPAMGYGKTATGDIPKNSTLIFEVKLIEIK